MKQLVITGLIGLLFCSCNKDKYVHFDERQLVFVNYSKGQELKFIDTSLAVQTLKQSEYSRDFSQGSGLLGPFGDFTEEYMVSYVPKDSGNLTLGIMQSAFRISSQYLTTSLTLSFSSYLFASNPDTLRPAFSTLTINGKTYTDVYSLKMNKNSFQDSNDTATLFHNKEYGVLEMLFPNGKKIVRTE